MTILICFINKTETHLIIPNRLNFNKHNIVKNLTEINFVSLSYNYFKLSMIQTTKIELNLINLNIFQCTLYKRVCIQDRAKRLHCFSPDGFIFSPRKRRGVIYSFRALFFTMITIPH